MVIISVVKNRTFQTMYIYTLVYTAHFGKVNVNFNDIDYFDYGHIKEPASVNGFFYQGDCRS